VPFETSGGNVRGLVVAHVSDPQDHASDHERRTLLQFASRLAALKGWADGGFHDPARGATRPLYFVPASTLTSQEAQALGVRGPDDLFGGVVPHAFVATKVISHPLVAHGAAAPAGWNPALAAQLGDAVLGGFAVFDPADALRAGESLLARGRIRSKPARATGGRGQRLLRDRGELQDLVAGLDASELREHGLVLEEDLEDVTTFSVGQVRVAGLVATYHGVQSLTRSNNGQPVFGGSRLTVARGDFDDLLALRPAPEVVRAIEQARRYDAAVRACYPGFYASRCNYDILRGRGADGRMRSAVLEQSWRAGGATGAELAALEVLQAEPGRDVVCCRCVEVFGDSPDPPANATVYYRGVDPKAGPLTKYTVVEDHVDPR